MPKVLEVVEPPQDIDWSVDDYIQGSHYEEFPDYTDRDIKRLLKNYSVLYDRQIDMRPVPSNVLLHREEDWWLEDQIIASVDLERAMAALHLQDPEAHGLLLLSLVGGYNRTDILRTVRIGTKAFDSSFDRGIGFLSTFLNGKN